MKSKIKLLVILLFAGFLSTQAQPGAKRTVEERVKQSVDRVSDSLKLNATQQTEAAAAFSQFYMAMDQLRSGLEPGARPDRSSVDKLVEIRDAKLKLFLSEAQFAKYKDMESKMRQRSQRPPGK